MSRFLLRRFSPFLSIRLKLSPFPFQNPNSLLSSRIDLQSRNSSHASTADESQDALHMTENCIQRMKELHTKEASAEGKMLRLSVETGGCSGFQYVFLLDYQRNPDDRVFEKDGVKLVVDKISYDFVKGATVDYVEELIRSAFLRFAGMPHPRILTAYLDESALFLGSGANHKAASTVSSKKLLHRGFTSTFVKA